MANTRRKDTSAPAQHLGQGAITDIVEQLLRKAMREHARELEKHLQSIHERLTALETK